MKKINLFSCLAILEACCLFNFQTRAAMEMEEDSFETQMQEDHFSLVSSNVIIKSGKNGLSMKKGEILKSLKNINQDISDLFVTFCNTIENTYSEDAKLAMYYKSIDTMYLYTGFERWVPLIKNEIQACAANYKLEFIKNAASNVSLTNNLSGLDSYVLNLMREVIVNPASNLHEKKERIKATFEQQSPENGQVLQEFFSASEDLIRNGQLEETQYIKCINCMYSATMYDSLSNLIIEYLHTFVNRTNSSIYVQELQSEIDELYMQ